MMGGEPVPAFRGRAARDHTRTSTHNQGFDWSLDFVS